ncbi:ArnT family glycosyltransferase [Pseudomonas sp. NA-150]|uniref:ArnT family glycosyltransferase n=1 Tax=Pseudomonas sp. NA-150 TaxID=3367525 RepID=UPI0037C506CA
MRREFSPRIEQLGLMLLAVLLIGAGLGLRQPLNVDEERFLGVALEMLQDGSWFIPHRAAEIYPDKPPLFMWAVAFFTRLTGLPKVALFLPALVSGMVATGCLYDLGRRLWNRRIGVIAGLLFLGTYQTMSILRAGQIDGFLCLWIAIGVYGLVRHLLLGPAWGWFYAACAAMGFGIATKGVGFVPLLMLIPYAYAVRKGWSGVVAMPNRKLAWALGPLVMLAAVAVWLVPMVLSVKLGGTADGAAYLDNILLHQTAKRYADAWEHREPFWYFLVNVIPKYWLPMFLALPWLVPAWRKQLMKQDGRVLVLLGWVVLVVLFFSLSTGKRKLYIYPALPGLVLLVAPLVPWLMRRWFAERPRGRKVFLAATVAWFGAWFVWGFVEPVKDGANPHDGIMRQAAELSGGADLVLAGWREGNWLFARQPIVHFGFLSGSTVEQAALWLRGHPKDFALVPAQELGRCFLPDKARQLGTTSRAEWYLVGPDADNGQCHPEPAAQTYRFVWQTAVI